MITLLNAVIFFQGTFAFALIKYSPLQYSNDYVYPWWGDGIGWILALSSMLCIPSWVAVKLYSTPGTLREVNLAHFLNTNKIPFTDLLWLNVFNI